MERCLKLKDIRTQNNLTQQQIADVLGITRSAYCSYEIGRRSIDVDSLMRLSEFYKLPVQLLIEDVLSDGLDDNDTYENESDIRFLSQLSRDEADIIVKYRMMNKEEKKEIKEIVKNKAEK
jgi:transcriptional regulator with XRE-family HTH domain